ncbi:hypothetical protein F4678DRAFT_265248 [Xylaria arbuscula]|nr:hypothetical protein F4678DRAFT_265248 [Xylaria arbuscula]
MKLAIYSGFTAIMAGFAIAGGYDASNMANGVYKVPIGANGIIDYENAVNLNMSLSARSGNSLMRMFQVPNNTYSITPEEDESEEYDVADSGENEIVKGPLSPAHCHWHYPHHHNRFLSGHELLNLSNYPRTLSMLMEWMTSGADSGWLERGEVRMAKSDDMVVGACIFKKKRLMTCVHELSLAMGAADRECSAGKVGCHVCLRNWNKDYFRFAASEAPNECECAWYYWK